jgi:hypothetical protein
MNLPIAERELRIAARAPRTYRARLLACVIFGAITSWMFWFSTKIGSISTIAPQTYAFIAHVALLMCMFSTNVTADALSSEKRNGTLGLLFLTDLRGADIVFGKLAALGLMSFYGLLGIIPILAMPVLMGGIPGQAVLRTALTLLNALFLALSIGLWISARSWDAKRAMNGAVWLVISMLWVLPGAAALIHYRWPALADVAEILSLLSPMYQQGRSNPFGIGMITDKYWWSLGITHAIAWIALWRACAILPHAWQDRAIISAARGFKKFREELRYGSPEQRAELRGRLLAKNAVHWLSSRDRMAPVNAWLFVIAVMLGWVAFWMWMQAKVPNGPPFWGIGFPAVMILYLGFRVRTCGMGGEIIARDRFSGALELLLSTTMTEKDVARGQWLSFARILLKPCIAAIVISTPLFAAILFDDSSNDIVTLSLIYFALIVLFGFDLVASMWTGMWTACFARNTAQAPGQAVLRLLLLPWLVFMGLMTFVELIGFGRGAEFPDVFAVWWLLCMANNIFWIVRSRRRFYERLRAVAAERYQPAPARKSWWPFWWRSEPAQRIGLSKAA